MTDRKLVTVRRVSAVKPIAGAEAIECATVEGWEVVIKKGEFQPGDYCVYFEIDAFLPLTDPRYTFLAKNRIVWDGKEGVRLRTIRLRGQLSQGLILPVGLFPEIGAAADLHTLREQDFTAALGIEKWEPAIPTALAGDVEGPFPAFIRKTDQERIQNLPTTLLEQRDENFEVTIKLDGASMTVFYHEGRTGVCSRNWWLKESAANALWQLARKDKLIEALGALGKNIALQGEIIGEGIQGNPERRQGLGFYVFDLFDIDRQSYLGRAARGEVLAALKSLGAQVEEVPFVETTTLARFNGDLGALLAYAEGSSLNPKTAREGVVFKRLNGACSFKVISNQYLLKHADR